MLDRVISAMRPVTLKGKGFVLDYVTPRQGIRHATVAGTYVDDAGPRERHPSPDLHGLFRERDDPMDQGAAPPWRIVPRRRRSRRLLLVDCGRSGRPRRTCVRRRAQPGRVLDASRAPRRQRDLARRTRATGAWPSGTDRSCCTCLAPRAAATTTRHLLRRPDWAAIEIAVRRLDDCLDDWGVERIDLMKIDVEGAEPRVLAGGAAHLAKGVVRHVMIEINGPRLVEAGSSPAALVDDLAALGFEPARLVTRPRQFAWRGRTSTSIPDTNGIASSCTGRPWAATPGVTA